MIEKLDTTASYREKTARTGAFRPVDLEAEARKIQDPERVTDVLQSVRDLDARMIAAVTTFFYAWRKVLGFIVFFLAAIHSLETRSRKQKKTIDQLMERVEVLEKQKNLVRA